MQTRLLHPLTEAQEGLWYTQALDPQNPILNVGQYLELSGRLDCDALCQALKRTIAEAPALQLRFQDTAEGPKQWVDPAGIEPGFVDVSGHDRPEERALDLMRADSSRARDLGAEPLTAFTIYRLGPEQHLLYERMHHLAVDGYGVVLITDRIGAHYSAIIQDTPMPRPFPPLSRVFEHDAKWRCTKQREDQGKWWREKLTELPDITGPAQGRAVSGHDFRRESFSLPKGILSRLDGFSKSARLNWPDVLTALTGAYLARWSGGDTVIGVPYMARFGSPVAGIPCMAMNVLPQRITLVEDATLTDWLRDMQADLAAARKNGLYRSEYLRRELGLIGGSRRLYGPLVNVQPFDRPPSFYGLRVGLHILGAGAVDDLTFTFRGDPQSGILFETDANPQLYTDQDVAGHAARLPEFIAAALDTDGLAKVPTASPQEIAAARAIADASQHSVSDLTLTKLIESQIAASPDAIAIRFDNDTLNYSELDRRSAALAAELVARGAGPERIVAIAMERSLELPIALLAVLRAGAAYLPLDPDHPPERLSRVLSLADPVVVLTSSELAGRIPARNHLLTNRWPKTGTVAPDRSAPENTAYVIFTSGSTGEPKGVVIEHRAIVNRLLWMQAHYDINASDRILQKTPAGFDVSVWEFFLPLISGAELVLSKPGAHRDPAQIAADIRRYRITALHFVPSMLSAFLSSPESQGLEIKHVFCSGEELTADQRNRFHHRIRAQLHNLYGPTEAAVDVSYWPAGPDDDSNPIPIGWPVWNTCLRVLDERMRPVPPGLMGQLYLAGVQLARGYLGREDLTRQRFVPDPENPDQRLYVTGDLARLRHDGAVEYLGRLDDQVKIRGLRIELGEINAAIMATGLVTDATVVMREDHAGDRRLVAYVVPATTYRKGELTRHLRAVLPHYMVPSDEVILDALPVTSNGKLDRKSLPVPERKTLGSTAQTGTERLLADLYAEVLHLPEPAHREADFFALGGDSLLAVRLSLRIAEETGHDAGLGSIFENPVLTAMAHAIDLKARHDGLGALIKLADGNPSASPLILVHPAGGLSWGYRHLARLIAPAREVWGIQHPGLSDVHAMPESLGVLAQNYAARVMKLIPDGPINLAGWSVGGIIAHAMAVELDAARRQLGVVAALDSYPADAWRDQPEPDPVTALRALLAIAGYNPDEHHDLNSREKVVAFLRSGKTALGMLPENVLDGVVRVVTDTNRLVRGHRHRCFTGTLTHIRAGLDHIGTDLSPKMWQQYCERLEVREIPFLHANMTSREASQAIVDILYPQVPGVRGRKR